MLITVSLTVLTFPGALLRIFPLRYVSWSMIALDRLSNATATRTMKMCDQPFGSGSKAERAKESYSLCRAIGSKAGGDAQLGENGGCKTLQFHNSPVIAKSRGHNIFAANSSYFDFMSKILELEALLWDGRRLQDHEYIVGDGPNQFLLRRYMDGTPMAVCPDRLADSNLSWNPWKYCTIADSPYFYVGNDGTSAGGGGDCSDLLRKESQPPQKKRRRNRKSKMVSRLRVLWLPNRHSPRRVENLTPNR